MNAIVSAAIALIQNVLPLLGSGTLVPGLAGTIIKTLTTFLPLLVTEIETVYEPVKAIITALHGSGEVTDEQKATLRELDVKTDAAFEAAVVGLDPDA